MGRRIGAGAIVAAALLGGASSAQAQAGAQPRLQVQPGKWNVDYGKVRCSLSRRLGGPQSPVLILTSYLGRDEPEIILMRDGNEALPALPAKVEVVLGPSETVAQGAVRSRRVQAGSVVSIQELGEGFIERVAASQTIRVQARGRRLAELRTPGAAAAVQALKTCNDDLLRSWGVDPDAQVTRKARQIGGGISDRDYPGVLIAAREKGPVVARFTVDATGRVTQCGPVVSSGFPRLDGLTCDLITRRFLYEPALGPDGQPIASITVRTVNWLLPE